MDQVQKVMDYIYTLYGSSSGHLFGLPPEHKKSVEAIVKVVLSMLTEETEEKGEWRDAKTD